MLRFRTCWKMFTQFRAVAPLGILAIFGQLLKLLRDQRGTGTESKGEWNMKQALVWIGALIAVGLALTYWKLLAALVVVGCSYGAGTGPVGHCSRSVKTGSMVRPHAAPHSPPAPSSRTSSTSPAKTVACTAPTVRSRWTDRGVSV